MTRDERRSALQESLAHWSAALKDSRVGLCVALRQGNGTEAGAILDAMERIDSAMETVRSDLDDLDTEDGEEGE